MPFCIEAEKLYERDPKVKREDVEALQEWLKTQPHLPKLEESQIILFLHSCYYNIEATKTTIDAYFTRKTLYPQIYRYPTEERLRRTASVSFSQFMPKKTPQGYVVLVLKLLDQRVENYHFINDTLMVNLICALYYHKNGFQEGHVGVFDYREMSLGHLMRVDLPMLKHSTDHLREGMPFRVKAMHIAYVPFLLAKVLALIKPLFRGTFVETFHFHYSLDTLFKEVPQECLPEEYGGYLPSIHIMQEEFITEVLDNADFFRWHDSQAVDESKRLGKSKYEDTYFGLDGTFRNLQID